MEIDFKKLTFLEQRKLTIEELCEYKRNLRLYQLMNNEEIKGIKFREYTHPIINFLIKARRILNFQTLTVYDKKNKQKMIKDQKRPIIFAITHTGKYDIEIVNEAIKKSYYLLSDDEEYMYRTVDGFITDWNGVIYVDSDYDKATPENPIPDTQVALETSIKTIKAGANEMWYPESIWNLSPNLLVLHCKYGIINAALEANAVILPIALDQRGEKDKDFYVNIGEFIYPEDLKAKYANDKNGNIEAINDLRDILATLKWEIWERFPVESRSKFGPNYYEEFLAKKIAEWPYFTIDAIRKREYCPPNIVTEEEVFKHLDYIEYNINNAFLMKAKTKQYKK